MAGLDYLDRVPIRLTVRHISDGKMRPGTYTISITRDLTTSESAPESAQIFAGTYRAGALSTAEGAPSIATFVPANDDSAINERGWFVTIVVNYTDGLAPARSSYRVSPGVDNIADGIDLRRFPLDERTAATIGASGLPIANAGKAVAVATIDAQGRVLDGDGLPITSGGGSSVTPGTGLPAGFWFAEDGNLASDGTPPRPPT